MKSTPAFSGVIDRDGKLHLDAVHLFHRYTKSLAQKRVKLVVMKEDRPKSRSQLGYLFGVVYPVIAEACGYRAFEIEAVHDALMRRLRGLRPDPNPMQLRVSLSAMTHEDVSAYIEDVRYFVLTEYGVVTPDAKAVAA